jgi:hypothetical protein
MDERKQPEQLTLDRQFQRRDEFDQALYLLDIPDREKRFLSLMYDISADANLPQRLNTADLSCEVRRDSKAIWLVCDQSMLAAQLGYADARTVRDIVGTFRQIDPAEILFRKIKVHHNGRERTVYLLNLKELDRRTQIDRESIICRAVELVAGDPFGDGFSTESHPELSTVPAPDSAGSSGGNSGRSSGGSSAGSSGGLSSGFQSESPTNTEVTANPVASPDSAGSSGGGAKTLGLSTTPDSALHESRDYVNILTHEGTEAAELENSAAVRPALPGSAPVRFYEIAEDHIRAISGFAVDGRCMAPERRLALFDKYHADAVAGGLAADSDRLALLGVFRLAGRMKRGGAWLRTVWANRKTKPPQLTPDDRSCVRQLLSTAAGASSPPAATAAGSGDGGSGGPVPAARLPKAATTFDTVDVVERRRRQAIEDLATSFATMSREQLQTVADRLFAATDKSQTMPRQIVNKPNWQTNGMYRWKIAAILFDHERETVAP